jgi:putative transposase
MTTIQATTRSERGQVIASTNGQVKRIDELLYIVKSQSSNGEYTVNKVNGAWVCACPDHTYRGAKCKHIHAVILSQSIRAEVKVRTIKPIDNLTHCVYCGSNNLKKDGIRRNKTGAIQKFLCRDCHKYMTFNIGFEKMKHNPQAITSAMQLYFSGESLRNTMESLELLGVKVSHQTVFNWIKKYISLMKEYAEKLAPNVSDAWRADEIRFKVRGNMKYLFAVMDDETRFWIAQEVADTKHTHDCFKLFAQSKKLMGKQPKTIITDGLYSYAVAAEVVLDEAKHVRHVRLQGDVHNNKMERMNGEIRDREKTMRGLKTMKTDVFNGMQIYHNFIRPHEALNGKTPSEACGIEVQGKNKWVTLIQNASKERKDSGY